MGKIKNKFMGFMSGRNGADELYIFLMWVYIVLMLLYAIVSVFVDNIIVGLVFTFVIMSGMIYLIFRLMSRNLVKRRRENQKFLAIKKKISDKKKLKKNMRRDRKTHVYKKCPDCKAWLRLPKKKGEHTVKCPACSRTFDIKI